MSRLYIEKDDRLATGNGNFGCEVRDGTFFVPQEIYMIMMRSYVPSVERFLNMLHSFPTTISTLLGWGAEEVESAKVDLVAKLRGHVDEEFLTPPSALPRPYPACIGALLPGGKLIDHNKVTYQAIEEMYHVIKMLQEGKMVVLDHEERHNSFSGNSVKIHVSGGSCDMKIEFRSDLPKDQQTLVLSNEQSRPPPACPLPKPGPGATR